MSEKKLKEELNASVDDREITDDELDGVAGGYAIYIIEGRCSQCGTSVEKRGSQLYCPKCKRYVCRAFF